MRLSLSLAALLCLSVAVRADELPVVSDVEGQPLGQNAARLLQALDLLGSPLPKEATDKLQAAADARDVKKIQELLDSHVMVMVGINPESRVKVSRGPAEATLQQNGYTVVIVKVVNESDGQERSTHPQPASRPAAENRLRPDDRRIRAAASRTKRSPPKSARPRSTNSRSRTKSSRTASWTWRCSRSRR